MAEKFKSRLIFNPGLALIGSVPNNPALITLNGPRLSQQFNRGIVVPFLFVGWVNQVASRHLGLLELIGCYLSILPGHS